jgi:hypothetical protein
MSPTRRGFLKDSGMATAGLAGAGVFGVSPIAPLEAAPVSTAAAGQPWYRRTLRWMQTNIAEIDVTRHAMR